MIVAHCFCQMSTMFPRQPGKWCGPGIRCKNTLDAEDISEIKAPPAVDGLWVDGLNTDLENRQGVAHVKKYDEVFTTTSATTMSTTTTTTEPFEELGD